MFISSPLFQANPAVNAEKINQTEPFFDKIVLKAKKGIPEDLDLKGCIAFTRDTNHKGWLHKLIYAVQRIIAFLYRKNSFFDVHLSHGIVILDKDKNKKDHLIIAHSVVGKTSIRTASRNYLQENYVTELVIYRPRNPNLRELIYKYGYQTSYTNPKHLLPQQQEAAAKKGKGQFSIPKMIASVFVKQKLRQKADKRIAYLAADLLLGNQFLTVKGKGQEAMFCGPYALAVLQGSELVNSLTKVEQVSLINLKDRTKIASQIFAKYKNKSINDVSKAYWNNTVLRIKTNFETSAHVGEVFHSISKAVVIE